MTDNSAIASTEAGPGLVWQQKGMAVHEHVRVASSFTLRTNDLGPEWCSFFLALGWFHHHTKSPLNHRLVTVVRVPARLCCAALCALGALVDSAGSYGRLSWANILKLEIGTRLHVRVPNSRKRNVREATSGVLNSKGPEGIWIRLDQNRQEATRIFLTEASLPDYRPTLGVHAGLRAEARRQGIWPFYHRISGSSDDAWLVTPSKACEVITTRAEWTRGLGEMYAVLAPGGRGASKFPIEDLLTPDHGEDWHLRLHVPGAAIEQASLIIFDGIKAFMHASNTTSGNAIIILSEGEFNETAADMVTRLVDDRLEDPSPVKEWLPAAIPTGIEMATMLLESSHGDL